MTEPETGEQEAPTRRNHAAWAAIFLALLLVGALAYLIYGPGVDPNYVVGIPVLVAIPFAIGGLTSTAFDPRGDNSLIGCALVPTLLLGGVTLLMWLVGGEGLICIAMVLAFWLPIAAGGALTNRWLRSRRRRDNDDDDVWRFRTTAWATLPALAFVLDAAIPVTWQMHSVTREITLQAVPEDVWPLVLSIPDIGPGEGRWTFTQDVLGVPRPSQALLERSEDGLVRKAQWGQDVRFDETVTALRPSRSIAWKFAFPDDSIQRHTDRHISPQGPNLRIVSGRYDLEPAGDGRTRLRLTTTYASRTRFDGYFSWWGERLLGDVQANVLAIVAGRVET